MKGCTDQRERKWRIDLFGERDDVKQIQFNRNSQRRRRTVKAIRREKRQWGRDNKMKQRGRRKSEIEVNSNKNVHRGRREIDMIKNKTDADFTSD